MSIYVPSSGSGSEVDRTPSALLFFFLFLFLFSPSSSSSSFTQSPHSFIHSLSAMNRIIYKAVTLFSFPLITTWTTSEAKFVLLLLPLEYKWCGCCCFYYFWGKRSQWDVQSHRWLLIQLYYIAFAFSIIGSTVLRVRRRNKKWQANDALVINPIHFLT